MISEEFLRSLIPESEAAKLTPNFVRQLTFAVVDLALRKEFGNTFAERTMEAALAVKLLLKQFEIEADPFIVDVCYAQVYENSKEYGWSGFWDKEEHIILVTQFGEIVDLPVSRRHEHPDNRREDALPIPAIWWNPSEAMPSHFLYLPKGRLSLEIEERDKTRMDAFLQKVAETGNDIIGKADSTDDLYAPILVSEQSIKKLREANHPWIVAADTAKIDNWPLPDYMQQRMEELAAKFSG